MAKRNAIAERVLITDTGWFMTENGHAVVLQYWDHNFQPARDAHWRGMIVLRVTDGTIIDWVCAWYTIFGSGFFPDRKGNCGEWDIVRKLQPEEIPAVAPKEWMPEWDAIVRKELAWLNARKNPTY